MIKKYIMTSLFILTIFAISINAQNNFDKKKLDDYLGQLEKNNKIMCGIAISKDGILEYENYIGFKSVKNKKEINDSTKFRIGSITKVFTAVMIMQLIEENKLTLETKLSNYFPEISNSKTITISSLLSHRSGIHNFTDTDEYTEYRTTKKTKEEILKYIEELNSDFQPGSKYEYSNSNYVLLGYIIEDITKSTYSHELNERIVSKLKLTNTYHGATINPKHNEALSYKYKNGKWEIENETDMSIPGGAGAIVSDAIDLNKFIYGLFNDKLISEKSLKKMTDIRDGYGRGLIRFQFSNKFAYGHNGGIDGFISNVAYFPDEKVAISITSNGLNYSFNNVLVGILSIYYDVPFIIPDLSKTEIKMEKKELLKYEGEYSSNTLPLNIKIKIVGNQLTGQATGQSAFPLTPYSKTEFRYEAAGIVIKFTTNKLGEIDYNSFKLNQGGQTYDYIRRRN